MSLSFHQPHDQALEAVAADASALPAGHSWLTSIIAAGCGAEGPPVSQAAESASAKPVQASIGSKVVVRRVDRESGRVVIRHDEIPGFMPAMTMPFDLKGDPILEELQVGDEVQGRLEVDDAVGTVLRELEITFPAVASPPEGAVTESLQARRLALGRPSA